VEFEYARPGMISLETAFGVVRTCMPELPLERLVALFALAPRQLFGLPPVIVVKDNAARFTLFSPNRQWAPERYASKSHNTPFTGQPFTGLPLGIIQQDKVFLRPL
jgi:dihydroorotase